MSGSPFRGTRSALGPFAVRTDANQRGCAPDFDRRAPQGSCKSGEPGTTCFRRVCRRQCPPASPSPRVALRPSEPNGSFVISLCRPSRKYPIFLRKFRSLYVSEPEFVSALIYSFCCLHFCKFKKKEKKKDHTQDEKKAQNAPVRCGCGGGYGETVNSVHKRHKRHGQKARMS